MPDDESDPSEDSDDEPDEVAWLAEEIERERRVVREIPWHAGDALGYEVIGPHENRQRTLRDRYAMGAIATALLFPLAVFVWPVVGELFRFNPPGWVWSLTLLLGVLALPLSSWLTRLARRAGAGNWLVWLMGFLWFGWWSMALLILAVVATRSWYDLAGIFMGAWLLFPIWLVAYFILTNLFDTRPQR